MYVPAAFAETRPEVLHDFLRRHSFGLFVSTDFDDPDGGFAATHLPFLFDPDRGPHGVLRGHVARANPHWRSLRPDRPVLVVFQGPHAYVSPRWYRPGVPSVPTWNYAVVHVHGRPRVLDDEAELRRLLADTVRTYEAPAGGRGVDGAGPWSLDDQPEEFVAKMAAQVVGFEVAVERIEGKFKLSQNRPAADRRGVAAALAAAGDPDADAVARLMAEPGGRE
jgi:transcriptional regulator